jgi:hypothetical protein
MAAGHCMLLLLGAGLQASAPAVIWNNVARIQKIPAGMQLVAQCRGMPGGSQVKTGINPVFPHPGYT